MDRAEERNLCKENEMCCDDNCQECAQRIYKSYLRARQEIAALREQEQRKWISVKEPPEPFVDVQCYCPNKDYGSKIVVSYNEVRNGPAYFADQHWYGEVTHWMPLPEPPKEGADHA